MSEVVRVFDLDANILSGFGLELVIGRLGSLMRQWKGFTLRDFRRPRGKLEGGGDEVGDDWGKMLQLRRQKTLRVKLDLTFCFLFVFSLLAYLHVERSNHESHINGI